MTATKKRIPDNAMPKRSNDFQELVTLVQQALAPTGAKVTSSAMVKVHGMRDPREIDVLIESPIGRYQMKIAVEAKDHGRKMDSVLFESLIGKYLGEGGVKVNKVVIVTSGGFYKPVIERAERLGIDLLTLSEAKAFRWAKLPFLPFENIPNVGSFNFGRQVDGIDEETISSMGKISCSHGHQFGGVRDFIASRLMPELMKSQATKLRSLDLAASSGEGKTKGKAEVNLDHPHYLGIGEDQIEFTRFAFEIDFASGKKVQLNPSSVFRFQHAPHVCHLQPSPPVPGATEQELRTEGRIICRCCGKDWGSLNDLASDGNLQAILQTPDFQKAMRDALSKTAAGDIRIFGNHQFQKPASLRFRSSDYPIDHISVEVHAVSAEAEAVCKQYELAGPDGELQTFTHLQATAGGKKFTVMIPHHDQFVAEKLVLKIEDDPPKSAR